MKNNIIFFIRAVCQLLAVVSACQSLAQDINSKSFSLTETLSVFTQREPEVVGLAGIPELPRQVLSGFGLSWDNGNTNKLSLTVAQNQIAPKFTKNLVACGPSLAINTLSCIDLKLGTKNFEMPVPGSVSSTPVYYQDSWIIGTNKGFLFRTAKSLSSSKLPFFSNNSIFSFWGQSARKFMKLLRESAEEKTTSKSDALKNTIDWQWYLSIGAEFVGTPLVVDSKVFAFTSNQFVYALDAETGKTIWVLRIAPEANLRLGSASMAVSPDKKDLIIGTPDGDILAVDPLTGANKWQHKVRSSVGQKFYSIIATPVFIDRSLVVASADGNIERISLDKCAKKLESNSSCTNASRQIEWTEPIGASTAPLIFDNQIVIPETSGKLSLFNVINGAQIWKKEIFNDSAIVAAYLLPKLTSASKELILLASSSGSIALVDFSSGLLFDKTSNFGEPVGSFFPSGQSASEICLSYAEAGIRCFEIR